MNHLKVRSCLIDGEADPGLKLNKHLTEPGDTVFRHACAMGLEGHRLEARRLALSVGTIAALAQEQEPAAPAVKRRAGGGVGQVAFAFSESAHPFLRLLLSR
ncbi:MAG: hypothetical protein ACXU9D_11140 [Xanthobacteraceae bacterium]